MLRQWWPSVSAVAMTTSSPTEWCHANLVPARRAAISRDTLRHSGGRVRRVRAAEAAVRVQAVVEGLAVDTQDVGLQVALLGRAIGAVPALERLPGCREDKQDNTDFMIGRLYLTYLNICNCWAEFMCILRKAVWEDQIHFRAHLRCKCCESTHKKLSELMDSAAPWQIRFRMEWWEGINPS